MRMMERGNLPCLEKVYCTCQIIKQTTVDWIPRDQKTTFRRFDELYDFACGQRTEHKRQERFGTDLHL